MKNKLKNEIITAKKEITTGEYIFWWICRAVMFSVLVSCIFEDRGGHYKLQMYANTALLFVLPELHLLPRKVFTLARLNYRAQTIASGMVMLTCVGGVYLDYYFTTWWFDLGVHFIGGAVCVPAGYYLMKAARRDGKEMTPFDSSVAGFGISCFTSLAWEVYEFLFDWFAHDDTQHWSETPFSPFMKLFPTDPGRYPLYDAMTDLTMGLLGAVAGGVIIRLFFEKREREK